MMSLATASVGVTLLLMVLLWGIIKSKGVLRLRRLPSVAHSSSIAFWFGWEVNPKAYLCA